MMEWSYINISIVLDKDILICYNITIYGNIVLNESVFEFQAPFKTDEKRGVCMELNVDQIRIVNMKPNGHCLVKGVAGSGKTTVAVNRIPNLLNHYIQSGEKVLIITYNKTLINYTKHLMKDADIQENLFFDAGALAPVEICTIDSLIMKYARKIGKLTGFEIATSYQMREAMRQAIHSVQKKYENEALITQENVQFLLEEVDWMKSCRYITREVYQNADRVGRMSIGENRFRLNKNSATRNAIFDVFIEFENNLTGKRMTDFKSNGIHVLQAFESGKLSAEQYSHVIVDESQDLTRVQLELVKYLFDGSKPSNSIMFIADVAQSIYTHSWLSNHSFKSIGFDMAGKSSILSKNYRTTYEIAQAAYSLIQNDNNLGNNDNFVEPTAIERHGERPYFAFFQSQEEEISFIVERVKALSVQYSLKDMVVLGATRPYLEHIEQGLLAKGIDAKIFIKDKEDFEKEQVKLYTLHSIKGLEFPIVFIAGINKGLLPYAEEQTPLGRKLLYVGMTRAKQQLYLSYAKEPSVYVNEMDHSLLQSCDTELSSFYKVPIIEYCFREQLRDINSREEMVRQWMIKECMVRWNYPLQSMKIEYPVQKFSSSGFVDIVLHKYVDGKEVPFILIEVKQKDADLERAMAQLKSYASCISTAEYIVVTDGYQTRMEQYNGRTFSKVSALPVFQQNLGSMYRTYTYENLKKKNKYLYKVNEEDKNDIILKNCNTGEMLDAFSCVRVPVRGSVAAGRLHFVTNQESELMVLPDVLETISENQFLLKVSGDSMIDFNIDDGDIIVMQKQNYAEIGDIVVAGDRRTNEATLKKYYPSEAGVMLVAGNKKYQPIFIEKDNLFINGILIGVLKQDSDPN